MDYGGERKVLLVPGIIINSSFFKGVTIVSRQATAGLPPISGSIASSSKDKKRHSAGAFLDLSFKSLSWNWFLTSYY